MSLPARLWAMVMTCASTATLAGPGGDRPVEARIEHTTGLSTKKSPDTEPTSDSPLLTTLDQVHTGERVVLDADSPSLERFSALLADRLTGEWHPLDVRLLGLLRDLATSYPGGHIELVSGYRSWKTNETMRKKGHHVSSHSQHSLGNACDFRLVPAGADKALDPRVVETEIRKLGWTGGVGVYPTSGDWFVHADVGRNRRWEN